MIREALNAYAATSDRVWAQDRTQTVGASEVGQCARKVWFSKNEADSVLGLKRDADHIDGWGARKRGSVFEDAFWAPAVRARFGEQALFVGDSQRTFVDGFLSGTPDGLLIEQPVGALARLGVADIGGDSVLLDAKTVDPRTRLDAPKPEHVFQVCCNMGLVRALTNYRPAYALLSYTDASFWDEGKEFPVAYDEAVFEEGRKRARDIMLATAASDLKPEGVIAGGQECEHCAFTRACGRARADRVPSGADAVDPALADTIASLARIAREHREAADAKMDAAREAEEELRAMLSAAGTRRIDHDGVAVRWSPLKGRPSWDNKGIREAAIAAGVDVERFSRVGDPSDRLAITFSEIPATAG